MYAMMTIFFQTLRFSSKYIHEFCIRFSLGKMSGEGYVCSVHYDKKERSKSIFQPSKTHFCNGPCYLAYVSKTYLLEGGQEMGTP